jgi:ubiquinone/menaquinone biosynthesis C-methylase UbiE
MNFDRLAPHYHWMETLCGGGLLQRARTVWLDELKDCRRILSAGEGHGRFAAACAARFPEAELTCIEASAAMIATAKAHLGYAGKTVRWHQADLLHWQTDEKFDAIATCFFLDCFPPDELAAVIGKLASRAAPNAIWLVVDFALPSRGLSRWRAQVVHALMYTFFRRVVALPARRLTAPDELLRAHGFQLSKRRAFNWGLLRSDLWHRT